MKSPSQHFEEMKLLKKIIVSGLGSGYLPLAPGTWGSAVVVGLFLIAAALSGGNPLWVTVVMTVLAAAATAGCIALGRFTEKTYARKDPPQCTLDEWAGQALALLAMPLQNNLRNWLVVAGVCFVLFRLFDIVKPPPARQLEKLPYGVGVVADDLVAGVYANILAQLFLRTCPLGTCLI